MMAAVVTAAMEAFRVTFTVYPVKIIAVKAIPVIVRLMVATVCGVATMVPVTRIEATVDRAVKACPTAVPGACAEKYAAIEPLRTVVAVGRAVVRSIAIVAIGADGSGTTDIYPKGNLGAGGCWSSKSQTDNRGCGK